MQSKNVNRRTIELINSLRGKEKIKMLFVCLGNICRSPAAEGVMSRYVEEAGLEERIEVDSAGILSYHQGELPDKRMRVHASRRGLSLTHHSRPVKAADFEDFDVIFAMDDQNVSDLREISPTVEGCDKIVRISDFFTLATTLDYIPDPYYTGAEGFELVLDLLENSCYNILDSLRN